MYKNNNRIHHLGHGMLVIMLLLGSNAMAEETQVEYVEPARVQSMTDGLQSTVQFSLASQLQQSSEALFDVEAVAAPSIGEINLDTRTPNMASPTRLLIDTPALHFTLDDWQSLPGASDHLSQNKG